MHSTCQQTDRFSGGRIRRVSTASLALLGILYFSMAGHASVVCRGSDGHLAVEWATAGECTDQLIAIDQEAPVDAIRSSVTLQSASADPCSDACTDLILIDVAGSKSGSPSLAPPVIGAAWALDAQRVSVNPPVRKYGAGGTAPSYKTLSSLRTVSIRC